jgi:DNA-binding NarL/FixJ family response regulator
VDLFVLDLYIPSRDRADLATHPELLGNEIRERTLSRVLGLLTLIEGVARRVLDPVQNGDRLLRELYRVVEEAETSLRTFASEIGQTPEGGFANLRHVRNRYPGVPAVFYTRKANSADVIRCFREQADAVLKKPQNGDDEDILALTVKTAGDTITLVRECMSRGRRRT